MRLKNSNRSLPLHCLGLLAGIWLSLVIPSPALAQLIPAGEPTATPVEVPENLTREQVRDLIARMSDDQVRELVITQLDKVAIAQDESARAAQYVDYLGSGMQVAFENFRDLIIKKNNFASLARSVWQQITDNGDISGWFLMFQLVGLLVVGWMAQRLTNHFLGNSPGEVTPQASIGETIGQVSYNAAMASIEIGAYAIGAVLFLKFTATEIPAAQVLWRQVILFIVVVKLVMLVVHLFLSPRQSTGRLIPVSDTLANQISGWILILTMILTLPLASIAIAYGADTDTIRYLRFIVGTIFFSLIIYLVIRLRHYGAELIGGDLQSGNIRSRMAHIWWMLTIVLLVITWLLALGKREITGESSLIPGLTSLFLLVSYPYLDMGLKWFVTCYFKDKEDKLATVEVVANDTDSDVVEDTDSLTETDASSASQEASYIAVAMRYARLLTVMTMIVIFVNLWKIDVESATALLVGERISGALYDISLTLILTWTLWGAVRISIERKLSDEKAASGDEEGASDGGGLGGTRTQTILPIIRFFVQVTLATMAVLITLSALGVNIGPLIAGAGVIGLAIGFGAQTLVRDVVSGLFYLIDDAFRIGEYVVIEQIRGTVERISIRSFQLRHHNGPVHTIPYGEIKSLTNWSRDWAIMKFELRLPYETDIEMVRKLIKQVGLEMKEDPVVGANMITPLKSQGVNRMDDSALIIRCKFTAVPGQQYLIRREAFTRIQKRFEENGIHFAPRRVLVESALPAAVAAAASVIDSEEQARDKPPDEP